MMTRHALYQSQSHPDRSIQYTFLNRDAPSPDTVLYCPGAGGVSTSTTLFQAFTAQHPDLAILCIDRWTIGPSCSRSSGLLQELSDITIELLDTLEIQKVSPVAHSAGAYQALDLAKRYPSRIDNLFCVCTHIPAALTGSKAASLLTKLPGFAFSGVMKLDQMDGLEKYWMRLNGKKLDDRTDDDKFVDTKELRGLLKDYQPDKAEVRRRAKTLELDYRLGWQRIPEVTGGDLEEMYVGCPFDITWYTTKGDVLFGPAGVKRVAEKMKTAKVEMVVVDDASHGDIFMRRSVWEDILRRIQH